MEKHLFQTCMEFLVQAHFKPSLPVHETIGPQFSPARPVQHTSTHTAPHTALFHIPTTNKQKCPYTLLEMDRPNNPPGRFEGNYVTHPAVPPAFSQAAAPSHCVLPNCMHAAEYQIFTSKTTLAFSTSSHPTAFPPFQWESN